MTSTSNPTCWFIFQDDQLLLTKIPHHASYCVLSHTSTVKHQHFIGHFNGHDCYSAEMNDQTALPDDVEFVSLRNALLRLNPEWFSVATKASQVIHWDKNHQFCGRCGNKTTHKPETFERFCTHCSIAFYPRISPSIIVLIQKDDQILMARSPHFNPGVYGLIAGFLEPGENVEEAIHREVKEEVGIQIKNIRYFGSQPWPFPDSLMLAFTADYASGEITIDKTEIEDAGWYRKDNLPNTPPSASVSIGRKLIDTVFLRQ